MKLVRRLSWGGPPLALQILVLLLGVLVVAQFVTLFLTLLLPPAPVPQYGLDDIAAVLRDEAGADDRGLQRLIQAGPPDVSGAGWLISEGSRGELAQMLRVRPAQVRLAFYTPLPFAGTAAPRELGMANDGPLAPLASSAAARVRPASLLRLAQYQPPPGGGMPSGTIPGGSFPGAGFPSSGFPRERGGATRGFPGSTFPPIGGTRGSSDSGPRWGRSSSGTGEAVHHSPAFDLPSVQTDRPAGVRVSGGASAPALGGTPAATAPSTPAIQPRVGPPAPYLGVTTMAPRLPMIVPPIVTQSSPASPSHALPAVPVPLPEAGDTPPAPAPRVHEAPRLAPPVIVTTPVPVPVTPVLRNPAPIVEPTFDEPTAGPPIAPTPTGRSLFGLAPAPFVQGDFVAALRLSDGRWAVVQPAPEPFPNSWQRRVLLWFVISLALVAPFAWAFARRLVKPLDRFAYAAEQLGRDPSAAIGPLDGPAEIGRAAHAFNLMQNRLRTFVDDRTAMVGAISHDLRTPLTRMRFRIEDVPDDVRDGLLEEVDEMEAMIAQVIAFIRDASIPGARERLDLGAIVEEAVEDARLVGGDVIIERAEPAPVEVDVLGVRRVLDNLLENAMKYGERARIRLRVDEGSAVAEIIDDGPGMAEDELDRAFEPFYRSEAARQSEKSGSGLGLAVCRSIARAHGGDVRLVRSGEGFVAEVRVPLAYGSERPLAA